MNPAPQLGLVFSCLSALCHLPFLSLSLSFFVLSHFSFRPGGRYFWSGCTRRRVVALPPGGVVELHLDALVCAPGSYNINRFRFNLEVDGGAAPPRVFFFPLQHWLHVRAAAPGVAAVATAALALAPALGGTIGDSVTLDRLVSDACRWVAPVATSALAVEEEEEEEVECVDDAVEAAH